MTGLVIKTTSNAYSVLTEGGEVVTAHIKGNIRLRGLRSTNPVAVGDKVTVEGEWIKDIHARRNYIVRKSTNLSKESHILAANIDQVALVVTLTHPETSLTFVDRFLATAEAYRVGACVIFNKVDLLEGEERNEQLCQLRALYEGLGYKTLAICAKRPETLSELRTILGNKTSLLSGNSGVGKSTLLNALIGEERAKTAEISESHLQGMHTTTFSEMYFLGGESKKGILGCETGDVESETRIIDTPGIRGFGTFDFTKQEVGHYFREIFQASHDCRFSDCLHTEGVPGCAVLPKVITGDIAISRYQSYLSLLGDSEEEKYR